MQDIRDITVQVTDAALPAVDADALVLNWFKEEKDSLPVEWAGLDQALNGALRETLAGDLQKLSRAIARNAVLSAPCGAVASFLDTVGTMRS